MCEELKQEVIDLFLAILDESPSLRAEIIDQFDHSYEDNICLVYIEKSKSVAKLNMVPIRKTPEIIKPFFSGDEKTFYEFLQDCLDLEQDSYNFVILYENLKKKNQPRIAMTHSFYVCEFIHAHNNGWNEVEWDIFT